MNRRVMKRVLVTDCLILVAVIAMFMAIKSQKRDRFSYKGEYKSLSLQGTWYKVELDTIHTVSMTDKGQYTEKDDSGTEIKSGTYEIGNHALKLDENIYTMNYVDEASELKDKIHSDDLSEYELRRYFYILDDNKNKVYYFSKKTEASDQVEDNCSTNKYFEKAGMFDENGFAIDGDGRLLAYRGDAKELVIPSEVTEIEENAMSADYGRAVNTDKVTIPGTVKRIASGAFSFSNIKEIYIEQGVETIDTWAFGDSNIEEIYFPEFITDIKPGILDTEEGLEGLKIYCKKGSQVDTYFKNNPPQGEFEIVKREE